MFGLGADSSWIERLPSGHQGTWRTLEVMAYLCRKDYRSPTVRAFLQQILASSPPAAKPPEAFFLFARDSIRFREDPPGLEQVADFQRTIEAGAGDCDDKSVWLATALLAAGYSVRFAVQSYGEKWDHVFVEFYDWSRFKWVALDPSADGHSGLWGRIGWRQQLAPGGFETHFDI